MKFVVCTGDDFLSVGVTVSQFGLMWVQITKVPLYFQINVLCPKLNYEAQVSVVSKGIE
jgi:hypothetical protein